MLYVLNPSLTNASADLASRFLEGAAEALGYAGVVRLDKLDHLAADSPGPSDGIVFFNPQADGPIAERVTRFLDRSMNAGAVLLPVALGSDARLPPPPASDQQSFDVVDHLRRRSIEDSFIRPAAEAFAREAISKTQPTCSRGRLRLFICHRRQDGEDLAAWLDKALSARHEHVFRDLVDIQVGDVAQEKIDEALESADVLLLLDTPLAGESKWITHEIETALGRSIPIVWVQVGGGEDGRVGLRSTPAGAPHFSVPYPDLTQDATDLADRIVAQAFNLSRSEVARALEVFRDIQDWASMHQVAINTLDQRQMIYELRYPEEEDRYPRRPRVHLLQVFGRRPTDDDREELLRWLEAEGWSPHERDCRSFDAIVMLDPTPGVQASLGTWIGRDHNLAYLNAVGGGGERPAHPKVLALLGAFPTDVENHQDLIGAIHDVTRQWFDLGGRVVMGGHPTFTPIVVGAAAAVYPEDPSLQLTIYQSRFFANEDSVAWLNGRATVELTESTGDRDSSLTLMRQTMIAREAPSAAVCIGGRTAEGGGHTPGIDQEVALVLESGHPVVLLAGAGGRAAELAARADTNDAWATYATTLDSGLIKQLSETTAYRSAMRKLWLAIDKDMPQ